jgi:hypothetical protein
MDTNAYSVFRLQIQIQSKSGSRKVKQSKTRGWNKVSFEMLLVLIGGLKASRLSWKHARINILQFDQKFLQVDINKG